MGSIKERLKTKRSNSGGWSYHHLKMTLCTKQVKTMQKQIPYHVALHFGNSSAWLSWTTLQSMSSRSNLNDTLCEIKELTFFGRWCQKCNTELKPRFYWALYRPLAKVTQPFEWVSMDFKGPLPLGAKNKYMLSSMSILAFLLLMPDLTYQLRFSLNICSTFLSFWHACVYALEQGFLFHIRGTQKSLRVELPLIIQRGMGKWNNETELYEGYHFDSYIK